ncbi:MAG: DNA repair protein RecO [Gammaproteobacteria bacterium]|nr:DNA repair protein RecO [Gammaproteobacteria bacterium]
MELQKAFLLHMRAFRDSSVLIDFFTHDYGRITLIARGARSAKSKLRGLLQPFLPLLISWSAKSELGNLNKVELDGVGYNFFGRNLIVGLYINELLTKLLHKHDAHPNLFQAYKTALKILSSKTNGDLLIEQSIRIFEKKLLADLGYGLDLEYDINGNNINSNLNYKFNFEQGFVVSNEKDRSFSGKTLLSLASEDLSDQVSLRESKILMRALIKNLLGDKKILSRELLSSVIPADAGIQRH